MRLPQNYRSRIHSLTLAISGLLITGRHSGTEEITTSTKSRMDGSKIEIIPPPDPMEVSLEEMKRWQAQHPGCTLEIFYPRKKNGNDPFDIPVAELKKEPTQRFQHKGMKKPPRLWQPNGQVPKRLKQEGFEEGIKKIKSPYR